MAGKKQVNNTNKNDDTSKGSPGKSSLASDGVIILSPTDSNPKQISSSNVTSEKLLQLVGNLSLKEKFSFLKHFDLIPKLEGRSPFSPEELEENAFGRMFSMRVVSGKANSSPALMPSGGPPMMIKWIVCTR